MQKTHDPRTLIEDYTLEMRSASDSKKKDDSKKEGGRKGEPDFVKLITSILAVFAEHVESLFFAENSEGKPICECLEHLIICFTDDDFDTDLVASDAVLLFS